MEIDIIKLFIKESGFSMNREELFLIHFSLFNSLYHLKDSAGRDGFYLHIDPMRIRLLKIPSKEQCFYYHSCEGKFCSNDSSGENYCDTHSAEFHHTYNKLLFDPLRDFYINEENLSFGKEDILEKLMKGVIIYALRKGEVEKALRVFGLSRGNRESIKNRYYCLAKKYHPDLMNGDDSMMKLINYSYSVLTEVFVI